MTRRPLIIDCDTGVDDALTLLLAFASEEFDILGVRTTDGNVSAELRRLQRFGCGPRK